MLLNTIDINLNFMKIRKRTLTKDHQMKSNYWKKIYKNNSDLIDKVSRINVDKELLLSLMGIETNFENILEKWI